MKDMMKKVVQEIGHDALSILKTAENAIEEVAVLTEAASALTGDPILGNISTVATNAHTMLKDLETIDEDLIAGQPVKDDFKNTAQDAAGLAVCFIVNEVDDVSNILTDVKSAAQDLKHGDICAAVQDTTNVLKSAADLTCNPLAREASFIISVATTVIVHVEKKVKKRREQRKEEEEKND